MSKTTFQFKKIIRRCKQVLKPALFYLKSPISPLRKDKIAITVDGTKFLSLRENLIERKILDTGEWEPWESSIVRSYVKSNCVVLDIGANIGYFSLLISKLVGPTGQVHCFEPTTYGYNRMMDNIKLNTNFSVENIRLNKKGLLAESCSREEALESRFSKRILANSEPEVMMFTTIDDYCNEREINRVDFIKIDVDGYDHEVMKGALKTLEILKPPVLAEFCNDALQTKGSNVKDYVSYFIQKGYSAFLSEEIPEPRSIDLLLSDDKYSKGSWNLLLLP